MRLLALLLVVPLFGRTYAPQKNEPVDVRRISVDGSGFVWVSGDRGAFRFDGARFVPVSRFGLPMEGSTHFAITSDGAIWARAANTLWRLEGDRFLQVDNRKFTTPIAAAGPLLYVNAGPLRVWFRQGSEWRSADGPNVEPNLRLHGEPDGCVWFGGGPGKSRGVTWLRYRDGKFERGEERLDRELLPQREVMPAGEDTIFTAHTTGIYRFARTLSGAFRFAWESNTAMPVGSRLLVGDRREVWYEGCGEWLSSRGRNFPMTGVREITPDTEGGVWGALGEKGLLYWNNESEVGEYSVAGLPDRPVLGVHRRGDLLYVARQDTAAVIDAASARLRCDGSLATGSVIRQWGEAVVDAPLSGVAADVDGSVWIVGKNVGVMRHGADGSFLGAVPNPGAQVFVPGIRQITFSADSRLWVAAKTNLLHVRVRPSLAYEPVLPGERYVSGFTRDFNSQLYAVSDGGLLRYEKGSWVDSPLPSCVLSHRLRTAALAADTERWFGYRDHDGFTRAVRHGEAWSCQHFDRNNGFPGDTQFLALDTKGRLWRGSDSGVHVRRTNGTWATVLAPDGEMHQLFHEEPDGSVLISRGDKLLRIPARLADGDPGIAPRVSYLEIDGRISLHPAAIQTRLGSGAVLYFSSLPERELAHPAPIEYRFDSGEWTELRDHALALDSAPRRAASLEFRYSGGNRLSALPISVFVPWWRSYPFGAAMAAGLGLAAFKTARRLRQWRYHAGKRRFLKRARNANLLPTEDATLPKGTLLQRRYRIDGLLAAGNFSHVYAAIDEINGELVVVKRLRLGASPPERLGRRLAQEVAAVSMVRHPGVVPITDTWVDDRLVPHLVMPLVKGPTLRARLRQGRIDRHEAMELLRQLADILAAAHARGVVHSDLKPENILISDRGPMVIDFGTSGLHLSAGLSEYSRLVGTVHYMAPEQLLGRYSKATDVYALAVISLEVLTGMRYAHMHLPMNDQWEPEFVRMAVADLGLSFAAAAVFVDALRFDPERRAQNVAEWMMGLLDAG